MIRTRLIKEKKRKAREVTEIWMNTPITFPPVSSEDISDEPIIVEAELEGYLVRRVYVDAGASVEVMFEHCFENLSSAIKARRKFQSDGKIPPSLSLSLFLSNIKRFGLSWVLNLTAMQQEMSGGDLFMVVVSVFGDAGGFGVS
ncbi:hypothetical protein Tco_0557168 [Tanacetum coccineum]